MLRRRIFEKILQRNSNDLDIAAKSFTLKPLTRFTELKILGLYNSKITAQNDRILSERIRRSEADAEASLKCYHSRLFQVLCKL